MAFLGTSITQVRHHATVSKFVVPALNHSLHIACVPVQSAATNQTNCTYDFEQPLHNNNHQVRFPSHQSITWFGKVFFIILKCFVKLHFSSLLSMVSNIENAYTEIRGKHYKWCCTIRWLLYALPARCHANHSWTSNENCLLLTGQHQSCVDLLRDLEMTC